MNFVHSDQFEIEGKIVSAVREGENIFCIVSTEGFLYKLSHPDNCKTFLTNWDDIIAIGLTKDGRASYLTKTKILVEEGRDNRNLSQEIEVLSTLHKRPGELIGKITTTGLWLLLVTRSRDITSYTISYPDRTLDTRTVSIRNTNEPISIEPMSKGIIINIKSKLKTKVIKAYYPRVEIKEFNSLYPISSVGNDCNFYRIDNRLWKFEEQEYPTSSWFIVPIEETSSAIVDNCPHFDIVDIVPERRLKSAGKTN